MPGDGEAVTFISNVLNEMQSWMVGWQDQFSPIDFDQLFEPRFSARSFRHAYEPNPFNAEPIEHLNRLPQLALATIDKEHVWQGRFTLFKPGITPAERLLHCAVVIARRHLFDVKAAIVGLSGPFTIKHHTGGDRRLSLQVTDIKTLKSHERGCDLQGIVQRKKSGFNVIAFR